jgi:hypothetical protein
MTGHDDGRDEHVSSYAPYTTSGYTMLDTQEIDHTDNICMQPPCISGRERE